METTECYENYTQQIHSTQNPTLLLPVDVDVVIRDIVGPSPEPTCPFRQVARKEAPLSSDTAPADCCVTHPCRVEVRYRRR